MFVETLSPAAIARRSDFRRIHRQGALRRATVALAFSLAVAAPATAQRLAGAQRGPAGVSLTPQPPCGVVPGTPVYSQTLSVLGLLNCNAGQAGPWSATPTPDGTELWIPLFGSGFGGENCRVARVDAQTWQLIDQLPVGLAPEELVFVESAPGTARYAFATNSSSSTVSILAPDGQLVRTIQIPFDAGSSFQTAFPFGLAVSPDQSEVFVGTLDGSGDIFVIDVDTLVLATGRTLHFGAGRGFGRMTFAGDDLVLPTTLFHPGFQGSTAEVILVDPDAPAGARTTVLTSSPDTSAFPSPQDVAFFCGDQIFVAGFDMGPSVYVLRAPSGNLEAVVPTHTLHPRGNFQGLGVSADGLLAVADILTNEIALIDARTRLWSGSIDASLLPGFNSQVNELRFSADGSRLFAPALASDTVLVFDVQ